LGRALGIVKGFVVSWKALVVMSFVGLVAEREERLSGEEGCICPGCGECRQVIWMWTIRRIGIAAQRSLRVCSQCLFSVSDEKEGLELESHVDG
jgi:hypothetical protein